MALSNYLVDLEVRIRAKHEEAGAYQKKSIAAMIEAGGLLIEAKNHEGLKHGQWLPFLKRLGMPGRTASLYMKLFRNRKTLEDPDYEIMTVQAALRAITTAAAAAVGAAEDLKVFGQSAVEPDGALPLRSPSTLGHEYIAPPFSVIDAGQAWHQRRLQEWLKAKFVPEFHAVEVARKMNEAVAPVLNAWDALSPEEQQWFLRRLFVDDVAEDGELLTSDDEEVEEDHDASG